jgi:hypothetical protein
VADARADLEDEGGGGRTLSNQGRSSEDRKDPQTGGNRDRDRQPRESMVLTVRAGHTPIVSRRDSEVETYRGPAHSCKADAMVLADAVYPLRDFDRSSGRETTWTTMR